MAKRDHQRQANAAGRKQRGPTRAAVGLRIIGGRFRGRKLLYSGQLRTRPMKDRLREAVFNLVGPAIQGKHVFDLFAGTGALALEALSRGADRATLIEQHYPTANIIRQNAVALGVQEQVEIVTGNVFLWWKKQERRMATTQAALADRPLAVFCSPPYDFYVQQREEMLELVAGMLQAASVESIMVVEADTRFDFGMLPDPKAWDVRVYRPAAVGIYEKE